MDDSKLPAGESSTSDDPNQPTSLCTNTADKTTEGPRSAGEGPSSASEAPSSCDGLTETFTTAPCDPDPSSDCSSAKSLSEAAAASSIEYKIDTVSSESMDTKATTESTREPAPICVKIVYNKTKYDHTADLNHTILDLKKDIEKLTGVPVVMQKVMFKGSTQDDQVLRDLKVTKNSKFMVVGSTMTDLLKVAAPDPKTVTGSRGAEVSINREPLCRQTAHKKVLDKHGKPDDVPPGIKDTRHPLPQTPLSGMYNKYGGKTRLTFKLDTDELWIGTKERTQKVKMGSIKDISSEPIEGHEEYHIMGIQLGPTELSKYWLYWVPAQYVHAIKDTVLGKWEIF